MRHKKTTATLATTAMLLSTSALAQGSGAPDSAPLRLDTIAVTGAPIPSNIAELSADIDVLSGAEPPHSLKGAARPTAPP